MFACVRVCMCVYACRYLPLLSARDVPVDVEKIEDEVGRPAQDERCNRAEMEA